MVRSFHHAFPGPPACLLATAMPEPEPAPHPDHGDEPLSRDNVAVRFYGAIYAYIRQSGRRDDEARELTQGFIADVLLGRDLLSRLDERRGQFRTLLMSAVRNYMADVYRHDHAARRHPGQGRVVRDGEGAIDERAGATPNPEAAFHRAWISMLVVSAAEALREETLAKGREWAWDIFDSRVLQPMLRGAKPPTYEALMARWNLTDPSRISNTVVAMRKAFAAQLIHRIGDTVDASPAGAQQELRELLRLLEGRNP